MKEHKLDKKVKNNIIYRDKNTIKMSAYFQMRNFYEQI